jgi:hypothetical protein
VRLRLSQSLDKGILIEQIGLNERYFPCEMRYTLEVFGTRTANDAINGVSFAQQEFREIRAILAGDTGDKRTLGRAVGRSRYRQVQTPFCHWIK